MEDLALIDRVSAFIRKNLFVEILVSLGMIFFVYGLIGLLGSVSNNEDIAIEPSGQEKIAETITVDV